MYVIFFFFDIAMCYSIEILSAVSLFYVNFILFKRRGDDIPYLELIKVDEFFYEGRCLIFNCV